MFFMNVFIHCSVLEGWRVLRKINYFGSLIWIWVTALKLDKQNDSCLGA